MDQCDSNKVFLLVELANGQPTGWSYEYRNFDTAAKKAENLNKAATSKAKGLTYIVSSSETSNSTDFKLTYKKSIIGIAADKVPIPGVEITGACPSCKRVYKVNLRDHYVVFPVVNAPFDFDAYCYDCDHEWKIPIFIEMTVRLPTQADRQEARRLEEELQELRTHKEEGPCFCQDCQEFVLSSGGMKAAVKVEEEEEDLDEEVSDYEETEEDIEDEEDFDEDLET